MIVEAAFARARAHGRAAFIPYLVAGDPDVETTLLILEALREAGVDAIELGIPYGDGLADGPTIAAAATRALSAGIEMDDVLAIARAASAGPPIVLFSYYNPILQYGVERFARAAAQAGVAGAIVPDLPLEESDALGTALVRHGMCLPLLVAPSTPLERAQRIAGRASGFVYVVSRLGVTGARRGPDLAACVERLAQLRAVTAKPLALGFGMSRPEQAREVAGAADGLIVGSALIDAYQGSRGAGAAARVREFVAALQPACAAIASPCA